MSDEPAMWAILEPILRAGECYALPRDWTREEAIAFWERMERSGGKQPAEFMSTHPSHATRIERLRELMPKAREEYAKGANRP